MNKNSESRIENIEPGCTQQARPVVHAAEELVREERADRRWNNRICAGDCETCKVTWNQREKSARSFRETRGRKMVTAKGQTIGEVESNHRDLKDGENGRRRKKEHFNRLQIDLCKTNGYLNWNSRGFLFGRCW